MRKVKIEVLEAEYSLVASVSDITMMVAFMGEWRRHQTDHMLQWPMIFLQRCGSSKP
jgi:hypothetical protein